MLATFHIIGKLDLNLQKVVVIGMLCDNGTFYVQTGGGKLYHIPVNIRDLRSMFTRQRTVKIDSRL
jgi:hypothetical protein